MHGRLEQRLKLRQRAARDVPVAMAIENLLRMINQQAMSYSNHPVVNAEQEQIDEIILMATQGLNLGKRGKKFEPHMLFSRFHKRGQRVLGSDDIFEAELAAVIAAIEAKATGKDISIKSIQNKLVGSDSLNIMVSDLSEECIEALREVESEKIQKLAKGGVDDIVGRTVERSGKSDVKGIMVHSQLDPKWEELFRLFEGRTFSVKNYNALNKDVVMLSLGSTMYRKAIMGALGSLGYSHKAIEQMFWQGIASGGKNGQPSPEVAKHWYHLQYGYELMGLGLGKVVNEEFEEAQQVDFFIYNDPSSGAVVVRSTAQMLLNEINKENVHNNFVKSIRFSSAEL